MNKTKDFFVNKIFSKKKIWIPLVLIFLIIIIIFLRPNNSLKNITTDIAEPIDLKQTILATGQVTSNTDLSLSFNASGIVKSINVSVGDEVKKNKILATLDQSIEKANLTQAQATLLGAKARLKKIMEGASNEEITLAEITLNQTKLTQEVLIDNAYKNLLNSVPEAVPQEEEANYIAPIISGTYSLNKEGKIFLELYNSSGGISFNVSGLTFGTGLANSITPQPIGNSGLYIQFPTGSTENKKWVIEIPNKKSVTYLANYNAYQSVLSQAEFAIKQREAELSLKKAQARESDVELANAEILSTQSQVEKALSLYNNTQIKAPVDGVITSIDIKLGELAPTLQKAIVLQDVSNLYIESNVNEANIIGLSIGLPVEITFDSFGPDEAFIGRVVSIDPSSTLISGVVNYKIKVSVDQIENLKPGMTANMTIKVKEKNNVIAIPSRSIINNKDGTKSIRLINNTKKKKYIIVPVTTGMSGDGGLIEIVDGLTPGDEYVVLINAK
jgi:RND family efflux transporter MFP subunit